MYLLLTYCSLWTEFVIIFKQKVTLFVTPYYLNKKVKQRDKNDVG